MRGSSVSYRRRPSRRRPLRCWGTSRASRRPRAGPVSTSSTAPRSAALTAFGANSNARLFSMAKTPVKLLLGLHGPRRSCPRCRSRPATSCCPACIGLSPFQGTELDSILRNLGVRTIVGVGVSVNVAIQNLTFDAVNAAYQVAPARRRGGLPRFLRRRGLEHTLGAVATVCTTDALLKAEVGARPPPFLWRAARPPFRQARPRVAVALELERCPGARILVRSGAVEDEPGVGRKAERRDVLERRPARCTTFPRVLGPAPHSASARASSTTTFSPAAQRRSSSARISTEPGSAVVARAPRRASATRALPWRSTESSTTRQVTRRAPRSRVLAKTGSSTSRSDESPRAPNQATRCRLVGSTRSAASAR